MIVNGKNTVIKYGSTNMYSNGNDLKIGMIYTVPDSKAVKWAKKNKIPYRVIISEKITDITTKKKGKLYNHKWKNVSTKIATYSYQKKKLKWKNSVSDVKTKYVIYGKKNGKYEYVGTTTKPKITSKYKHIKIETTIW